MTPEDLADTGRSRPSRASICEPRQEPTACRGDRDAKPGPLGCSLANLYRIRGASELLGAALIA